MINGKIQIFFNIANIILHWSHYWLIQTRAIINKDNDHNYIWTWCAWLLVFTSCFIFAHQLIGHHSIPSFPIVFATKSRSWTVIRSVASIACDRVGINLSNSILPFVSALPWCLSAAINLSKYDCHFILDCPSSNICDILRATGDDIKSLCNSGNYCN